MAGGALPKAAAMPGGDRGLQSELLHLAVVPGGAGDRDL